MKTNGAGPARGSDVEHHPGRDRLRRGVKQLEAAARNLKGLCDILGEMVREL